MASPSHLNGHGHAPPRRDLAFELGDHVELRAALLAELERNADAAPVADQGALHTYSASSGAWTAQPRAALSKVVQGYSGAPIEGDSKRVRIRKGDVDGTIALALDYAARPGFFDAATPGLAFANGFVCVEKGKIRLTPHSPDHAARFSYPFAFDPSAKCPRWQRVLEDAFRGDVDAKQKAAVLQEFAGACAFGMAPSYAKAIVMWGAGEHTGRNGKNTIGDIMTAAMPTDAVCNVAPQNWGNEYRRDMLAGKLMNFVSELPEADILDGESFKAIITGDGIDARKIRESPYSFRSRAGHLLLANRLPASNDQSKGFWERLILIVFNRVIPAEERIVGLAKMVIDEELQGVVAWMVAGARRLMAQGRYTDIASSRDAVSRWKRGADPIATFLAEKTRPARSDEERTRATELYEEFKSWALANGYKTMTSHRFGLRMSALGYGHDKHTRVGTKYAVALLRYHEEPPEPPAPEAEPPIAENYAPTSEGITEQDVEAELRRALEAGS